MIEEKIHKLEQLYPELDKSQCRELVMSGADPMKIEYSRERINEERNNSETTDTLKTTCLHLEIDENKLKKKIKYAWSRVQEVESNNGWEKTSESIEFATVPVKVRTPKGIKQNLLIYFNWQYSTDNYRVEAVVEYSKLADEWMVLSRRPKHSIKPGKIELPDAYPESRIAEAPPKLLQKSSWISFDKIDN